MLISSWSAIGDREITIERMGDINFIKVKSYQQAFSSEFPYDQLIFNKDKNYYLTLGKDVIELHEE